MTRRICSFTYFYSTVSTIAQASMNVLRVVCAYRKRNVHAHCLSLQFYLFSSLSPSCSHLWCIVLRFSIPLPSPYHKPQPTTLLHEHARVHYQRTTSYNHIYVAPVVTHTDATCNEVAKKRLVHRNEMLFVGVRKKRAKEEEKGIEREEGMKRDREKSHKCNWKPLADIFAELPLASRRVDRKEAMRFLK